MTRAERWWPAALAALTAAAYGVLTVRLFAQYQSPSWDNAIFEQVISAYSRLDAPRADIKGPDYLILGDHFSPVLVLLAPVYRVFPHAQTLLLAQVLLVAVSAFVVTRLAVERLGLSRGMVLGGCYCVSFGIQSAVASEFHEVAFAAPLLALAGAAYVRRRWTAVLAWSLPLVLVKEDLGLTVAVIGVAVWLAGERRRGAILAATGVVSTVVIVGGVIPLFGNGDYDYVAKVGADGSPLATLLTSADTKAWTLVLTFAVCGFAAMLSPWALVVVPTLAWRFAGNVPYYWGTDWHYSLVLMPVVFVAGIAALERHEWARTPALATAALVAAFWLPTSPLASLANADLYRESVRAAAARAAIDTVPDGLTVEADITSIGHLVSTHRTFWIGSIGDAVPDAVLLDTSRRFESPGDAEHYAEQKYGGDWRTVFDDYGFKLALR